MDTAISGKPILNHQLGNMREVPGVVRHKNETRLFRDCTNEQIEIVNFSRSVIHSAIEMSGTKMQMFVSCRYCMTFHHHVVD